MDSIQLFGTQLRKLITADMDDNMVITMPIGGTNFSLSKNNGLIYIMVQLLLISWILLERLMISSLHQKLLKKYFNKNYMVI
jgi:hypothetical protein